MYIHVHNIVVLWKMSLNATVYSNPSLLLTDKFDILRDILALIIILGVVVAVACDGVVRT